MKNRILTYKAIPLLVILLLLNAAVFAGNKKGGSIPKSSAAVSASAASTGKVGDSYRMNINNINMPMNRSGVIAAVNIADPNPKINGAGGKFAGDVFLFSSGFFLSGMNKGNLFANAVASASLVEDYVPGTVESGQADPRAQLYVVKTEDAPFSQSWIDWKDAVALGADYYDGNNDGSYDPVDLNSNGEWDADEDRPDLIGDETAWCVYNDGLAQGSRRWNTVAPLGIEVRQTVFAFASSGSIGNIMFVRYRFKYVGLGKADEADVLTDCYFGVWSDTDLGDPEDDLIGSDVARNVGFTYNDGPDANAAYGNRPPAFFIDFFSGPISYVAGETFADVDGDGHYTDGIDTPLDTAYSVQGQVKGIKVFPGAKNLGISSFVQYINGDSKLDDPENATEARNYMLGLDKQGATVDPCSFSYGEVKGGVQCATVNNRLWYSGDPVTQTGWINTVAADARQMTNVGPFELQKGVEKEIVVAYVVGQGENAINSVEKARAIDDGAQEIFDNNFLAPSPPPAVQITVAAGEDFIDISWPTPKQVAYNVTTNTYDLHFRGYNVYAYQTFSTSEIVDNQSNIVKIANYQLEDFVNDLYLQSPETAGIEKFDPASDNRLDYATYTDESTGRIRLRIKTDPFTGGELIKGKKYYFAVTSYAINYDALVNRLPNGVYGTFGDYYLSSETFVQSVENVQRINVVTFGDDEYTPPFDNITSERTNGGASGVVQYDVIDKEKLTGDTYSVTFIPDTTTALYSAFWSLRNDTKGITLVDSSKKYLYGLEDVNLALTDGFIMKISEEIPHLDTVLTVQTASSVFDKANSRVYYLNTDIPETKRLPSAVGNLSSYNSTYVTADKLRRVEIRFGTSGKAYRYLNGFFGANASQQQRFFKYAAAVTSADTVGKGIVGQWDTANDRALGFVDVPFTVWVKDFETGEERQLACAIIEKRASYGGIPDGTWDPGTNLNLTGEFIIAFNSSYDPSGSQLPYVGGFPNGSTTVWADLNGGGTAFYPLPETAPYTAEQRAIAKSPLFDVLYVFGLQKAAGGAAPVAGDIVAAKVANYPYTANDVFTFTTPAKGELTLDEQKALFEKVNVFPNPLYGYNVATSWEGETPDDPFVTFSNLPNDVTVKIFSLSGALLRTLTTNDKSSVGSSFLRWDLQNESGLRVASGLYIAIVSSPQFGEKILKFSIIMPQKQIQRY